MTQLGAAVYWVRGFEAEKGGFQGSASQKSAAAINEEAVPGRRRARGLRTERHKTDERRCVRPSEGSEVLRCASCKTYVGHVIFAGPG